MSTAFASPCREQDGVACLSVTSRNTTGEEWVEGLHVGGRAKSLLLSKDFKPTDGITTEVVVLKGALFEDSTDSSEILKKVCPEGSSRKLETPNAEIICLIREKFTNEELEALGLSSIIVMHEPIKDSDGDPALLCMNSSGNGHWLGAVYDSPGYGWSRDLGFVFTVSQKGESTSRVDRDIARIIARAQARNKVDHHRYLPDEQKSYKSRSGSKKAKKGSFLGSAGSVIITGFIIGTFL